MALIYIFFFLNVFFLGANTAIVTIGSGSIMNVIAMTINLIASIFISFILWDIRK